ncbi:MAG: hypothetical protein AAFQ21_10990 [Pseudomonadota bacterium]
MKKEQQFQDELAKAAKKLEGMGRSATPSRSADYEGGLQGDFVLPYSSMPKPLTTAWVQNKKYA